MRRDGGKNARGRTLPHLHFKFAHEVVKRASREGSARVVYRSEYSDKIVSCDVEGIRFKDRGHGNGVDAHNLAYGRRAARQHEDSE